MTNAKDDTVQMITPPAKAIVPHLVEHEEFQGVTTGRYALTLEFPPDHVEKLQESIASVMPAGGVSPLKLIPADAEYSGGNYRMKCKSRFRIKVIDLDNNPLAAADIGMNDSVRCAIKLAGYKTGVNTGVTVYLQAVQLLEASGAGADIDWGDNPPGFEGPAAATEVVW